MYRDIHISDPFKGERDYFLSVLKGAGYRVTSAGGLKESVPLYEDNNYRLLVIRETVSEDWNGFHEAYFSRDFDGEPRVSRFLPSTLIPDDNLEMPADAKEVFGSYPTLILVQDAMMSTPTLYLAESDAGLIRAYRNKGQEVFETVSGEIVNAERFLQVVRTILEDSE